MIDGMGTHAPNERIGEAASRLLAMLRCDAGSVSAFPDADLHPRTWEEVLGLAQRHGIAPLLLRALESRGGLDPCPEFARVDLKEARRSTALANLEKYGQFRVIATALREANVPVMALKGLHVAELVYRDIGLRSMSDIDILVPREALQRSIAALQSIEYGFDEDVSGAGPGMLGTKCNIGLAHRRLGVWLEVHWSLAEPQSCYAPPMDDIWSSAVRARLGDAGALVMSPEFLLLYVCAHLACNHVFGFNLRGLCDIAEIVRAHPDMDWDSVIDLGQRHGWTRGVAAAIRLARDHLGAAVPDRVLTSLGGDRLDPELLAEAMEHLVGFSEMPGELTTAPNLLAIAGGSTLMEKFTTLWKRLFVPRAELALLYGVPVDSARIVFCYARRLRDLFRKYAAGAWALWVSDPQLARRAARHARLAKWIGGG